MGSFERLEVVVWYWTRVHGIRA